MKKILSTLIFIFIFFQTYCQVNLNAGLVAHYPFNGNPINCTLKNVTLNTNRADTPNNEIEALYNENNPSRLTNQMCSGSLGAPIVNITFGSGSTNPGQQLSALIPGATTNYNFAAYATGNPPQPVIDGDYALVNAVPVNSAWFTGAKDHTGNTDGYMAFFNAAPSPGEFYRQTVTGLCPGTTYEFSSWIANVVNPSILPNAILPNVTFKILDPSNSNILTNFNTGDISMNASFTWKQYSFLFLTPSNISSVILILENNNIGGNTQIGNDLVMDDITFRPCGPLLSISGDNNQICKGGNLNLISTLSGGLISPAYQWQISTDGGVIFSNIPTASTQNYTFSTLTPGTYFFRLRFAEATNINSPTCSFLSNSVSVIVNNCNSTTQSIINSYTPVLGLNPCNNEIIVENASEFKAGDTVILMQMKGAIIDSSNTSNFGTVIDYKSAGNYEYNYISYISGNVVALKNVLLKTYEIPEGVVQLIRVPFFASYTNTDVLTCLPWDGKKGGVLAFNVAGTFQLNNNIDISGKGFWGGQVTNTNLNATNCYQNNYFYPTPSILAAPKGESITKLNSDKTSGKGALASAGGGGLDHNSGGGGGGNATSGGFGGYQLFECNNTIFDNRGIGGRGLSYSNAANKIFLAGGGGSGHCNNGFLVPSSNTNYNGGRGGGIAIINSNVIEGNNYSIIAKGDSAYELNSNGGETHDGMGGGGAGGTVLLFANSYSSPFTVSVNGGKGGDMHATLAGGRIGPGGGGAGGVIWFKQAALPGNVVIVNNGGKSGVLLQGSNSPYGSTDGAAGLNVLNLNLPFSTVPFKKNIDSVRFNFNPPVCNSYTFNGLGFTNNVPVNSWQWFFGNAGTAATQNASFTFTNQGTYDVKLIATDPNGCKDSFAVAITTIAPPQQPVSTLAQPTCTIATGSITVTAPLGTDLEYSINGTSFQNSPFFTAVPVGSYSVVVRNKLNNCLSPASSVTINPATGTPPVPQASVTDQPDCVTTTGTITINSPLGAFYDYSIDGVQFQAGTVFNGLSPGNYSLIVRNNLTGCTAASSAITVDPVPTSPAAPVIGNITQPGCTVNTGSFTIASPLGPDLLYSLNGNNPQASTNFTGLTPGTYAVTVSNSSNGCISASNNVVINPEPVIPSVATASVTEQPSCTISSGTIAITAPIGNNYQYSVDGVLFQSSLIFQNLLPNNYNVVVRDKISGCSSQPLPLIVQPDISATGSYFMANAFTPNGDGLNDCFGIKNWGVITELQFLIYNRWGELVFSTTNPTACWDGNFKGQPSILGNYVYYIKANTLCGKIERKGNLALIR